MIWTGLILGSVIFNAATAPSQVKALFIQPYLSAGAGIDFVNYSQYFGQFSENDASFPLAAQVGAGVAIPLGNALKQSMFKVGVTYNFSAYNRNNLGNLSSVGANAGIVFPLK